MNADSCSASAILSAASQGPFGSDRRVVVVRGMEQWRDRVHQAEADRLAAGIADLAAFCMLDLDGWRGRGRSKAKDGNVAKAWMQP